MKGTKNSEFILGIGLDNQEQGKISEGFDPNINLINLENTEEFSEAKTKNSDPLMAIIPWRVWKKMPQEEPDNNDNSQKGKKFLVIESEDQIGDLSDQEFIAQCFIAVTHSENSTRDISKVLDQTKSYREFNKKYNKMSKEIELERELLTRKNSQLSFLNTLLSHAHQHLEIDKILNQIKEDMQSLIQVDHCHAIFWPTEELNTKHTNIYLSENISSKQEDLWINFLLKQKKHSKTPLPPDKNQTTYIKEGDKDSPEFDSDYILTFSLSVYNQTFGILALQTQEAYSLGADRNEVLNLGVNHLAQVCYNALQFSLIKEQAKYDGLTRLNNRQYFDEKLKQEFNRHHRHEQELSLLMLDIDYFKDINDNFGHQAGDSILKELGNILNNNVRQSDFPARYGGEEFAIILPHTECEQAKILAERIRNKVEKKHFKYENLSLNTTISIGITSFIPTTQNNHSYLIYLADQALYKAKKKGRNTISSLNSEKDDLSAKAGGTSEQAGLLNTSG